MKTAGLLEALERRHPDVTGEWVCVREAFAIDLLAVRVWQGEPPHHARHGYEVKASRSDFLHELKHPEKRAPAMQLVDFFWFAAPWGVIAPQEVPANCGLLQLAADGRWHQSVRAPRLDPRDLDRGEWASLLRHRLAPARYRQIASELARERAWKEILRESVERGDRSLERAHAALDRIAGDTVTEGTRWRGPWPSWTAGEEHTAEVMVTDRRDGFVALTRTADEAGFPRTHHLNVGQLLADYEVAA